MSTISHAIERLQYRLLLAALGIQCFLELIGTLCPPTQTWEFIFRHLLCTHATIEFGSVLVVAKLRLEALLRVLFVNDECVVTHFLVLVAEELFVAMALAVLIVDNLLVATAFTVLLVDKLLVAAALAVLLVDKFLVTAALAVLLVDKLLVAARLYVLVVQLCLMTVLSGLVSKELLILGFIVEFCCGLLKMSLASDQGSLPGFQLQLLLMLVVTQTAIKAVSG
jgi:hypothetical protein